MSIYYVPQNYACCFVYFFIQILWAKWYYSQLTKVQNYAQTDLITYQVQQLTNGRAKIWIQVD